MNWQTARKRRLLSRLSGTVLEIGAGRGANFGFLAPAVRWIGLEPQRRRHPALTAAAARAGHDAELLDAVAEAIPLPSGHCDAVISTVVLCSVADQAAALAEIRRVLRPGGSLVFLEHVAAAHGTWTRRLQRWWAPLSRRLDNGCDPARDTEAAIAAAGFAGVELEHFEQPFAFGMAVPLIAGRAWTLSG